MIEDTRDSVTVELDGDGTHIDIYDEVNKCNPYFIELAGIKTAADIMGWAIHLSEKKWVTAYALEKFIELAARTKNISIHR